MKRTVGRVSERGEKKGKRFRYEKAGLYEERKTEMGSAVNIEANGRAIGMKRTGMTLLPGPSAICNWFSLLLLQLATTDLWT